MAGQQVMLHFDHHGSMKEQGFIDDAIFVRTNCTAMIFWLSGIFVSDAIILAA